MNVSQYVEWGREHQCVNLSCQWKGTRPTNYETILVRIIKKTIFSRNTSFRNNKVFFLERHSTMIWARIWVRNRFLTLLNSGSGINQLRIVWRWAVRPTSILFSVFTPFTICWNDIICVMTYGNLCYEYWITSDTADRHCLQATVQTLLLNKNHLNFRQRLHQQ